MPDSNTPENKPTLTIVENMNIDSVDKVDIQAKGKTKINAEGDVKIIVKKSSYKRPPIENGLTSGHKGELKVLIEDWVKISNGIENNPKKAISYPRAWSSLNRQAKSLGKSGVASINEYPDCDFEKGKKFIKQQIAILRRKPKSIKNDGDAHQKSRIKAIQARCNQLKVSRPVRQQYMVERFGIGKDSLTKLTLPEIEEFYSYVMSGLPNFKYKKPQKLIQPLREEALLTLINKMEQEAKENNIHFDRMAINISKREIQDLLEKQDTTLFAGLSLSSFSSFWTKQQLCKLASGRPRSS